MWQLPCRAMVVLAAALTGSAEAASEHPAMVLASAATEAVVVVQSVDRQERTVEIEAPNGARLTVDVPPQSQHFDALAPGARFCVRVLQSVALSVRGPMATLALTAATTAHFSAKGATPMATIVTMQEIEARIDAANTGERILMLTGPDGHSAKVLANERVDLSALNVGDLVIVRYTEALAFTLIGAQQATCAQERKEPITLLEESSVYHDAHSVESIRAVLDSPIPPGALQEAGEFDDRLVRTGQLNKRRVSVVTDQRYQRARRIAERLLAAYGEDASAWTVRVLDSSPPKDHAFVVGGRSIYVFTGLLDHAASVDEVAFVFAHEIAHSRLKHLARRSETFSPLVGTIMEVGDFLLPRDATTDSLDLVAGAIRSVYSKQDEQEADALGAYMTLRAGFDPLRAVGLFRRLIERDKERAGVDGAKARSMSSLLADHPTNENRIAALVAAVDYLDGKRSLDSLAALGQGYNIFAALSLPGR